MAVDTTLLGTVFPPSVFTEEQTAEGLEQTISSLKVKLTDRTAEEVLNILSNIWLAFERYKIELSWCTLTENATQTLNRFRNLYYLALTKCKLSMVPHVIPDLNSLEHLDMSGNNIMSLPDSLAKLKELKTLRLLNCALVHFPPVISQLIRLKELSLAGNQNIVLLPKSLKSLQELTTLNVSNCGLITFPKVVSKLKKLKYLLLRNNKIKSLPRRVSNLKELEVLDVSANGISYSEVISELPKLRYVFLGANNIMSVFDSLEKLEELEVISAYNCGWKGTLAAVSKLTRLKCLDIRGNYIVSIPSSFADLKKLEILDASECDLQSCPEVISQLIHLKRLILHGNNMNSVPESLVNLRNLHILDLSECGLLCYPEVVSLLGQLFVLHLGRSTHYKKLKMVLSRFGYQDAVMSASKFLEPDRFHFQNGRGILSLFPWQDVPISVDPYHNDLKNLSSSVALLSNLQEFDVSNCGLKSYHESISQLAQLQILSLEGNNVRSLPDSLSKLKHLKSLNVSRCGFTSYPEVISELKNLVDLIMKGNALQDLPDSLSNLNSLKLLDISECHLTTFPDVVTKLDALRGLMLSGNSLNSIPNSIVNLKTLYHLEVATCDLSQHIEALTNVYSLRHVDLSKNKHLLLPPSFQKLIFVQGLCLSVCNINQFPGFISHLSELKHLNLSNNGCLSSLPTTLTKLRKLKYLSLKGCGFQDFPNILLKMSWLVQVDLSNNRILRLGEETVKRWCTIPSIVENKQFLNIFCDLRNLEEPPYAIFEEGPEACHEYYCSTMLTSKQSCSFMNVQVLGEMGSGKTSLIQTMKNDQPSLVNSEEPVYSIGTVKLMAGDALLQIYDYAGDDIYDLAYHMFIKSTKQIVILAVNLPEYSEAAHDRMVTRWLSSISTSSADYTIIVACTQVDRCTDEEEIKKKRTLIKSKIVPWLEEEHRFMKHLTQTSKHFNSNSTPVIRMKFIVTSSKNMGGIEKLMTCLVQRAKEERVVVPKHWRNMYTSFYRISDDGQVVPVPNAQSEITQFFRLEEAFATFMNSLSRLTKWVTPNIEKDFHQCLQFFNNIGMLLWYKDDKQLQDMVFHNVSFLITVLQHLFQRDIQTELEFDPDNLDSPGQREIDFNTDVKTFAKTGLLTDHLLQNIWKPLKMNAATREALKHLLINLDLCYVDNSLKVNKVNSSLRFPWFVSRDDNEGMIDREWPEAIPALHVQFSLVYDFYHRVPPAIYERFCVRIQNHLTPYGHVRHDFRNTVYIAQDDVEVLIQKDAQPSVEKNSKPSVQIHLRCPAEHLLKLQPLLSALYHDFEELCAELPPSLDPNGYLQCPHCLLKKAKSPTQRSARMMTLYPTNEIVVCDDDERIPAAFVYPLLLASDKKYLEEIEKHCNKMNSLVSEDLLMEVSKRITAGMELALLGAQLGVKDYTVSSILRDYPRINDAGYHLLSEWRREGIRQRKNGTEMERTLITALCSKNVGMNVVAAELKHHFQQIRDSE